MHLMNRSPPALHSGPSTRSDLRGPGNDAKVAIDIVVLGDIAQDSLLEGGAGGFI